MSTTRQRKLRAATYATQHGLAIPKGIHPNAPGEGKPTRTLYKSIERLEHLPLTAGWSPQLEWLLFPGEHALAWRVQILANARFLEANRALVSYSMGAVRSHWLEEPYRHLPLITDCSMAVKWCYGQQAAGIPRPPDPTGEKWRPEGYTGTMLTSAQAIKKTVALPADFVVISKYGEDSGSHAVLLMESGMVYDPMVFSHGGNGSACARFERLSETISSHTVNGHAPHVTFMRTIVGG